MKRLPVKLEVLTPVHVSAGQAMDPFDYIISQRNGKHYLSTIDLESWILDQPNPADLANDFANKPIPALRRWISEELDPEIYSLSRSLIVSHDIAGRYKNDLGDHASQHSLKVMPHVRNGLNHGAILPGSSLKGAIRTAVIDWLDREVGLNLRRNKKIRDYNQALNKFLGMPTNNAFKRLKISDFPAGLETTLFVEAREIGLRSDKPPTPKDPAEVLASRLLGRGGEETLYGRLSLGDLQSDRLRLDKHPEANWDWTELADLVSAFFRKRYLREKSKFYSLDHFGAAAEALGAVEEAIINPQPGRMVLRVGHYSHIESVTITNNEPRVPGGKSYGTTRTLADGRYPFGWVRLTPVPEDEWRFGAEAREERDRVVLARHRERRHGALKAAQEIEQRRIEEERRQAEAAAAEQRLADELEALPEEQKLLRMLELGQLNENEVNQKIYANLDQYDDDLRQRTAKALKKYYQAEGKWSGKLSKKQKVKKLKIMEILA